MSRMHEVTTVIRRPNAESPHPQRLSNGCPASQLSGVGDANDTNNNDEKSNKIVLTKAPKVPPPTLPKSKRTPSGVEKDDRNLPYTRGDNTTSEVTSRSQSVASSLEMIGDVRNSLPMANRSTSNTIRDKIQPAKNEESAANRTTNTNAVNDSNTKCSAVTSPSWISNECHNGKRVHSLYIHKFAIVYTSSPDHNSAHSLRPPTVSVSDF